MLILNISAKSILKYNISFLWLQHYFMLYFMFIFRNKTTIFPWSYKNNHLKSHSNVLHTHHPPQPLPCHFFLWRNVVIHSSFIHFHLQIHTRVILCEYYSSRTLYVLSMCTAMKEHVTQYNRCVFKSYWTTMKKNNLYHTLNTQNTCT